jgi:hypothetical protein
MMALPVTGSNFGEPSKCSSAVKAHGDYRERFESCTFLMNDKMVNPGLSDCLAMRALRQALSLTSLRVAKKISTAGS